MRRIALSAAAALFALPRLAAAQEASFEADAEVGTNVVQMTDTRTAQAAPTNAETQGEPARGAAITTTTGGGPAATSDGWEFSYHGYFRAPMRIGIASREETAPGQSETTYHTPIVPDDQYLSWQHTRHSKRSWAEAFFSVGNKLATGTIAIQGFQFADASWPDPASNFGISQAFITLTPDTGYENMRLVAKAGSFWAAYGKAGRYDAGAYDTYLFGRTHALGGTLRSELDLGANTLWGEFGIGTKEPNPNAYNRSLFTIVDHYHAGLKFGNTAEIGLHYMHSFAQSEYRPGAMAPDITVNTPDGNLKVYGIDGRLDAGMFGYGYLGFSQVKAEDAITVGSALEVIHSFGGGEFALGITDNYLNSPGCAARMACSNGNGTVSTLLGQYELSLQNLLQGLEGRGAFWGEGQDLKATLYGMYNSISSDDPAQDGVTKLKYGADLEASIAPWFAAAVRADSLSPNSKIPEQNFSIVSPRLIFRSQWVTREEINLQYSRYFYDRRTCATEADPMATPADGIYTVGDERCVQPPSAPVLPAGFGATTTNQDPGNRAAPTARPDVHVVALTATMWW